MATSIRYFEITPMFSARFNGRCELEGCQESTYENITKMMGVEVFTPETQDFERKFNDKPFWICAKHYMEVEERYGLI